MSGFTFIKTFDRYSDDSAPQTGSPAATGVWALRITKFDAGAKIGFAEDNLRTIRALTHYRRKPGNGVEPFEVYISGNVSFEYVTSPLDYDIFDGSLSPQSSTDVGANQVVVGPDATGVAPSGNPVVIGIVDSNGNVVRPKSVSPGSQILAVTISDGGGGQVVSSDGAVISRSAMVGGKDPGGLLRAHAVDVKGRLITPGDSNRQSYIASLGVPLLAGAGSFLVALEAGASKTCRIRRIKLWDRGALQTAGGWITFGMVRSTGASSGGGTQAPGPLDSTDAAYSGVARQSVGATLVVPGGTLAPPYLAILSAFIPAALANRPGLLADVTFDGTLYKPITIQPGVANGIAIGNIEAAAGAAGNLYFELFITEE